MIEVEMSKDIREYEPTVMAGMNKRQLIFAVAGVALGGLAVLSLTFIPILYRVLIGLAIAVVIIISGWVKMFNMPLYKFMLNCLIPAWFFPSIRKNKPKLEFYKDLKPPVSTKKKKVKKSKEYKRFK